MSISQRVRRALFACIKQGVLLLIFVGPYMYYMDPRGARPALLLILFFGLPVLIGVVDLMAGYLEEDPHRYRDIRRFLFILAATVGMLIVMRTRAVTGQLWILEMALFGLLSLAIGTMTGADNANTGKIIRKSQVLSLVGFGILGSILIGRGYATTPRVGRLTAGFLGGLTILCTGIVGILLGASLAPWLDELPKVMKYLRRMGSLLGAFVTGYVVIVFVFAGMYAAVWQYDHSSFNIGNSATLADFFYFSSVTAATVGYGDIVPSKPVSRLLACLEVALAIGWITIVLAVIVSMVQQRQELVPPPRDTA